jgi:hypothetical protein
MLAVLVAAPVALARTRTLSVATIVRGVLPRVKQGTQVAVRLPNRLPIDSSIRKIYVTGGARTASYDIELAAARNCGGANACFLGSFRGARGERPAYRRTVALRGGRRGYFKPLTCGASCSAPVIQWIQGGVLYEIALKGLSQRAERRTLIALANAAIAAGPR